MREKLLVNWKMFPVAENEYRNTTDTARCLL